MAEGRILWELAAGRQDPFSAYAEGLGEYRRQQTVLEQLAGQRDDRQFSRETNARDFRFRQQESDRNQSNWRDQYLAQRGDAAAQQRIANAQLALSQQGQQFNQQHQNRVFGLQERTANEAQITTYETPDGSKIPIRVDRQGNAQPIIPQGMPQANPTNPYAPNGKTTDDQAKAALYANRMAASNDIIGKFENINQGPSGNIGGVVSNLAPSLSNPMMSADRQQFNQAQRDFINAVLRRESGAVIADSEFTNARQQYFPQPGDSKEVLAQKAANRLTAIQGIMGAAGKQYQPPANYRQQPQAQQPQQAPVFAVNPTTGQRIQFLNGQWVPAQ